jgi:TonB family protein
MMRHARFIPYLVFLASQFFFGTGLSAANTTGNVGSDDCPVLLSMLDVPLHPVSQKIAPYPEDLKKQKIAGGVLLYFVINAEGRVILVHVLNSTEPRFNETCINMVKDWKFQPPLFKGAPISCSVLQPIAYAPTPEGRRELADVLQKNASLIDSQLDNRPKATRNVDPEYPKGEPKTTTYGASAVVVVDVDGNVMDAKVSGKDLPRSFQIEILSSLLQWKFEKGIKDGKVVPWRAEVIYLINPRRPDGKLLNSPSPFDKPLIMTMSSVLSFDTAK